MNALDILRGLMRRWYIVLPGVVLAAAVALGMWAVVPPTYERTASQLLLPGRGTLPENATNPFLYLGGLSAPTDVLVRTVNSAESLRPITDEYPDAKVGVARDVSASGPIVRITVSAPRDDEAATIVESLIALTETTLDELQSEERIASNERITISLISKDDQGLIKQRDRLVAAGLGGVGVLVFVVILASVVDGLAKRSGRSRRVRNLAAGDEPKDDEPIDDEPIDDEPDSIDASADEGGDRPEDVTGSPADATEKATTDAADSTPPDEDDDDAAPEELETPPPGRGTGARSGSKARR